MQNEPENTLFLEPNNHWEITLKNTIMCIQSAKNMLKTMENVEIISTSNFSVKVIAYYTRFKISGVKIVVAVYKHKDKFYLEIQRRSGDVMWFYSIRNILLKKLGHFISTDVGPIKPLRKLPLTKEDNINGDFLGHICQMVKSKYTDVATEGLVVLAKYVEKRLVKPEDIRAFFSGEKVPEKVQEFLTFLEQ